MKLLTSLLLIALAVAHAEVKVATGEISDKRSTEGFFKGLEVEVKLSGPEVAECKAMRVVLKEAKDDAGNVLKEQKNRFGEGEFENPRKKFGAGFDQDAKDVLRVRLELENPSRSAKSVAVDATAELHVPSKDPAAVISVEVAKAAGKPVENAALKAAGVTLKFKAPKGTEGGYAITDPQKKVAAVEFCSADGKPLETTGRMSSGFGSENNVTINLENAPPAGMIAKVYLLTDKSVIRVPVKLPAVPLP
jgi:hypothetical protein